MQNNIFYEIYEYMYKKGYIGFIVPKNKNIISKNADGCCIYIKKTYQILQFKSVDYYNIVEKNLKKKNFRKDRKRGRRVMAGIMCILKKISNNKKFIISNVHLLADPDKPDVKNLQVVSVLNELAILSNNGIIPTILCGDFNSMPNTSIYKTITKNKIYSKFDKLNKNDIIVPKKLKYKMELRSCYKKILGKEPKFTTYTNDFVGTLDYIFVSNHWKIKDVLPILSEKDIIKEKVLPNSNVPSDHLPIMTTIYLKNNNNN